MTALPNDTTRCGERISPSDHDVERAARHEPGVAPLHPGHTPVVQNDVARERTATGRVMSVPGAHGRARNGIGSNGVGGIRSGAGRRGFAAAAAAGLGVRAVDGCMVVVDADAEEGVGRGVGVV